MEGEGDISCLPSPDKTITIIGGKPTYLKETDLWRMWGCSEQILETNWEGKCLIGKLPKLSKGSEFSAIVRDSRQNWTIGPDAHVEEDETGREGLQVSEEVIHKDAERIKVLTKTAPFKLPTVIASYT